MSIIRDQPGVGVNSLAKAMDVRQPTASNLVKALADQGLIEVRKEGVDRRAVQLYLRPGAAEVLLHAPGPFSGVLPQALAGLKTSTLLRLEQDLGTLIRALGAPPDLPLRVSPPEGDEETWGGPAFPHEPVGLGASIRSRRSPSPTGALTPTSAPPASR